MKIHGIEMNEHHYNGLLRTYAGASAIQQVKEKHIDIYMEDAWSLFNQVQESENLEVNIYILNSLLLLHANAFRVDDLDSKVLPLYEKFRIKPDVFTYQHLTKLYLNLRDLDMVKSLYRKMKKQGLTPNQMLLNNALEAGMRSDDADIIYDSLLDFIDIKRDPHRRLVIRLNNIKHIPDRIYMLLKQNFSHYGGAVDMRAR